MIVTYQCQCSECQAGSLFSAHRITDSFFVEFGPQCKAWTQISEDSPEEKAKDAAASLMPPTEQENDALREVLTRVLDRLHPVCVPTRLTSLAVKVAKGHITAILALNELEKTP